MGPNSPNYISSKAWVSGQFTVAKFLVSLIKSFKKLGLLGQRNSLLLWPIVCLEIVYLGIFFPLLIKAELKHRLFESGDNDYKNPFAFSCFTADRCALCGGGSPLCVESQGQLRTDGAGGRTPCPLRLLSPPGPTAAAHSGDVVLRGGGWRSRCSYRTFLYGL